MQLLKVSALKLRSNVGTKKIFNAAEEKQSKERLFKKTFACKVYQADIFNCKSAAAKLYY